jgi:hypothetical protein
MRSRPSAPPRFELVATLFRVHGASRSAMRARFYRVETGREVRLEYGDRDDLIRSQLFPVDNDDDGIAKLADEWHRALIAKAFEELPLGFE